MGGFTDRVNLDGDMDFRIKDLAAEDLDSLEIILTFAGKLSLSMCFYVSFNFMLLVGKKQWCEDCGVNLYCFCKVILN